MKTISKATKCILIAIVILLQGIGNPVKAQWATTDPPEQDNTTGIILIGVAGAALVTVVIILIVKSSKKHHRTESTSFYIPSYYNLPSNYLLNYQRDMLNPLKLDMYLYTKNNSGQAEFNFPDVTKIGSYGSIIKSPFFQTEGFINNKSSFSSSLSCRYTYFHLKTLTTLQLQLQGSNFYDNNALLIRDCNLSE